MADEQNNTVPIQFQLKSEEDFKLQESFDTHTITITNQNGNFTEDEQSASLYSGAKRLTDLVIVNEIPGVGTTYNVYIENNILVIPNNLVSSALGNPHKLYVFFTDNNYNIFVYNPNSTKYLQLGSSVSSSEITMDSAVNSVENAADIGNPEAYTAQTIVYYPQ